MEKNTINSTFTLRLLRKNQHKLSYYGGVTLKACVCAWVLLGIDSSTFFQKTIKECHLPVCVFMHANVGVTDRCTLLLFFRRTLQREYEQLKEQHGQRGAPAGGPWESECPTAHPDEADLLAEAKLLRQHKGRLEARMHILEEHNKQLESQLHRLRQLLHQVTQHLDQFVGQFYPKLQVMAERRQW